MFRFIRSFLGKGTEPAPSLTDQTLLVKAQISGDAGDLAQALNIYRSVLARRPGDAGVMVLLGNLMKDSGDLEGALRVYRDILKTNPRLADVWLQMGRALKLSGDRTAAQESYERALLIEPGLADARAELEAAGLARHQSQRISAVAEGAAPDAASALAWRIEGLLAEVKALRRELGEVGALRHLPPEQFALFSERYSVPHPRRLHEGGTLHFIAGADLKPHELHALVLACHSLSGRRWTLSAQVCEADVRRYALADPRIQFGLSPEVVTGDWVVFLGRARPDAAFCEWLDWVGAETGAAAFTFDGVEEAGDASATLILRSKPDVEMLAARPEAQPCAVRAEYAGDISAGGIPQFSALVDEGRVGHLPLPLVRGEAGALTAPLQTVSEYPPISNEKDAVHTISVVILSQNNADMAERFVESLKMRASNPDRVDYVLVNNGAERKEAVEAFDRLRGMPSVTVIDDDTPFNWSLLNNRAAEAAKGEAVVFANDDLLLLSDEWDARVVAQLSRPEVGVIGARLLFPNDTIQHAGIQLGWRGGSIHEGLGASRKTAGPGGRWMTPRRASAVTGAFLAVRRAVFDELDGFDAKLMSISHSDIDFCLKARERGLSILYDPDLELYHFESTSRGYDSEDAEKQARFDAEKRAFEARWGASALHEPSLNPFWSDYHAPFHFISQPRLSEIEDYIRESAAMDIWSISRETAVQE